MELGKMVRNWRDCGKLKTEGKWWDKIGKKAQFGQKLGKKQLRDLQRTPNEIVLHSLVKMWGKCLARIDNRGSWSKIGKN